MGAGAFFCGIASEMQCGCAGVCGYDLPWADPQIRGYVIFEQAGFLAHAKVTIFKKDTANSIGLGFADNGA